LERERFFTLLAAGMTVQQASVAVGINGRTGRDWRRGVLKSSAVQGSRIYPCRSLPPRSANSGPSKVINPRFLSEDERVQIADLHLTGASIRAIARELGRAPSTISRELTRNSDPRSGHYRPHAAQRRAWQRRVRPKMSKLAAQPVLRERVQHYLGALRWSPEQISAQLRRDRPDDPTMNVSHETIYQALYLQGRGELRRELARCLRTGRAVRKPRRRSDQRRSRFVDPMLMISDRPAEVTDRAVPGHWEGDLILGAGGQSAVGTLVERATRFVLLVHLPRDHSGEAVRDGLIATMRTLPEQLRRSLTWDQGCEMARHRDFSIATDMPVYFCDPASPWQRGSNENTNGLLRQFLPKGSDLRQHGPEDLADIARLLNTRPRKTLGWETPAQRLADLLV
jgi:IS30 family transposase